MGENAHSELFQTPAWSAVIKQRGQHPLRLYDRATEAEAWLPVGQQQLQCRHPQLILSALRQQSECGKKASTPFHCYQIIQHFLKLTMPPFYAWLTVCIYYNIHIYLWIFSSSWSYLNLLRRRMKVFWVAPTNVFVPLARTWYRLLFLFSCLCPGCESSSRWPWWTNLRLPVELT